VNKDELLARRYRAVLLLVHELHLRGHQRLRAAPGLSPSGAYWRCSIAPTSLISRSHGARLQPDEFDNPLVAHYSSGQEDRYFDWTDAAHATPSGLARRFIERFPDIAEAGNGSDWLYAGWYVDLLHLTYPNRFPFAYCDWEIDEGSIPTMTVRVGEGDIRIPMPPPGEAGQHPSGAH
jgi:hypothetical protein